MGVRLHAVIDFFGLKEGEAHGLVALIKQKEAEARIEECPALVSCGSGTIQTTFRIDRLGVIVAAESEKAAQQKLQGLYSWLNANGPDYDVVKTSIFDRDIYREVI